MKLLRVLETGRFERLGSNRERQVKVRVVSATNADLPAMIRDGSFREDLYYRLNTIELRCRRWPNVRATSCRWPNVRRRRQALSEAARSAAAASVAGQRARTAQRDPARRLLATGNRIEAGDLACRARRRRAPPATNPTAHASNRRCNARTASSHRPPPNSA
jgi:hypothetical protein